MRVHEVAAQLKVSPSTVRRYVNEGFLSADLTPFGHRVFTQEQVDEFLGKEKGVKEEKFAFYARSSDGDMNKIKTQFSLLEKEFGNPDFSIHDRASGLNDKRKGLARLFALSKEGKITGVCVTNPDRLSRFGIAYLEEVFSLSDVELHFLGEKEYKSSEEELMQDFMSLIASFSGKFYRLRGREQKRKLLARAEEELSENQTNH